MNWLESHEFVAQAVINGLMQVGLMQFGKGQDGHGVSTFWRRRAVRQREGQDKTAMKAGLAAARISRVPAGQRGNHEVQEGQGAGRAAVRRDASAM